jgi:CRP-like cAMP-binding protein
MTKTAASACIRAIRSIPLFAALGDRALRRVAEIATEVDVQTGHVLVESGMAGSGMFVVVEGSVVVERGAKRIEYGPGELFGEMALLSPDAVRSARVRAASPLRCLAIARRDFLTLLESEPKIAVAMLGVLAQRLAAATKG